MKINNSDENTNVVSLYENVKTLADRAFWKIDARVGELFDEFVVRDNLPTHDKYHGKIECRGFYPAQRRKYDDLYYESVEKACEEIKNSDPLAYRDLVDEHGDENQLIRDLKFN